MLQYNYVIYEQNQENGLFKIFYRLNVPYYMNYKQDILNVLSHRLFTLSNNI